MKKINGSKILLMTTLVLFFALSCKKDQAPENALASAKKWYVATKANAITSLKSNHEVTKNITREVQWANAQLFTLNDGTTIVGAPVKVELANGTAIKGSYTLFISKVNESYRSFIVHQDDPDYFSKASVAQVQQAWQTALGKSSVQNGNPNQNVVMRAPPISNCIDWYWTETVKDENGNIISYYEYYSHTTCYGGENDNPDGGTGVIDNIQITWGESNNEKESITITEDRPADAQNPTAKKRVDLAWWIYNAQARGIKFRSLEKAVVFKPEFSYWQFESFDHVAIIPIGLSNGTVQANFIAVDHSGSTTTNHTLKLIFQEIYTYSYEGQSKTLYSPYVSSSNSWSADEVAKL